MNATATLGETTEKIAKTPVGGSGTNKFDSRCRFRNGLPIHVFSALVVLHTVIPTHAASLSVGGYGQPSNLKETFGVYGDLDANFVSDEGRTDRFAYKLVVVEKKHMWGSCALGIHKDIHGYRYLSFWIRSPQGASAVIGLTDADRESKPQFARPLIAYLPGGTSNDWRQVVIPLKDFEGVGLKKSASLVFEVGVRTAGNDYGDAVFIDDIRLLESNNDVPETLKGEVEAQTSEGCPGTRNVETNLRWIRQMIHPRTILVQASAVGRESWTFVCATALHALLEQNDLQTAARIGDALVSRQNPDGSWPGGWDYATGAVIARDEKVGEVAWACMSLLQLHAETRKTKYLKAVKEGIDWANKFQILDSSSGMFGAYTGGRDLEKNEDFPWVSTEHQGDMLCLLYHAGKVTGNIEHFARARLVADWIARRAWDAKEKRFQVGYDMDQHGQWKVSTYDEPTDVQAWLPMVLAATRQGGVAHTNNHMDFGSGINWLLQFEKLVTYKAQTVRGFSTKPFSATNSVNTDHILYVIKAARILGMDEIANKYAAELDKVRNSEGLVEPWMIGPKGVGWPLDFPWPHATAICFDTFERNPFELKVQGSIPDPKKVHEAVERLIKKSR